MPISSDTNAAPIYISSEEEANEAIAEIRKYSVAGLDSEFEGVDVGHESCVGKARIHVFSVATPSGPLLPTGVNAATSYVFSEQCLLGASVRGWLEDDRIIKSVHNQPVDAHAFRNKGVILRGGANTLAMARWWYPHRAKFEGFGLDALGKDLLGVGKTEDFDELFGYDDFELRRELATKKQCECGAISCRKRSDGHLEKHDVEVEVERKCKVRRHTSLFSLHPGHSLWSRYLAYAAFDAVLALWLYQYMMREGKKERPYPWSIAI